MVFILLLSHIVDFYGGQQLATFLAIDPSPNVLDAFRAPEPYVIWFLSDGYDRQGRRVVMRDQVRILEEQVLCACN
jgi:hypothetical protein